MGRPPSATLAQFDPELAKQMVDQDRAQTISKGSAESVEWECRQGHRWLAKVYNRTNAKNPTGCPYCDGKKILPGFNDIATTRPDVARLFVDQSLTTRLAQYSNKKVTFRCDNGHEWTAPVSRLTMQGSGCPYCSGRVAVTGATDLATLYPDLAAQMADPSLASSLRPNSKSVVEWVCRKNPSHRWRTPVDQRVSSGSDCPVCSGRVVKVGVNDIATTYPDIAATLVDPEIGKQVSHHSERKVEWRCTKDPSHTWVTTVSNRIYRSDCPVCSNHKIVPGINDLATTHPNVAAQLVDPEVGTKVSAGSKLYALWQCQTNPDHQWETTINHRTGNNPTGCPFCFGPGPSASERDLANVVTLLADPNEVLTSDHSILPGRMELDIVVPASHIAIEFNGVYWHSDKYGKKNSYHQDKSRMAADAGYQLIHVWEDDWKIRRDVVIRAIAHKMHAVPNLLKVLPDADPRIAKKIYARNLEFGEVTNTASQTFLYANHIQGGVTATRIFVLRDADGDIRALLAVRSPQNNARMHRAPGEWEVQRYATLGFVPGGFTRLLAHTEKVLRAEGVELTRWISFSSNDMSDGGMYEKAGFTADEALPPDYKYVGNVTQWRRVPKERFQKKNFRDNPDLLWDESWTETIAAEANGLSRVYDAGKTRWVKPVA